MAAPLRVLAIDDEPLAIRRIEIAMSQMDEARLIGTARNGREALAAIDAHDPDVLLLDIRMSGMSGFDVVEALRKERAPQIIFVTAFDAFASRAFDVSAVDYVLKPVEFDRLRSALGRARDRLDAADARDREAELRALVDTLRQSSRELESRERYESEIWVQRRGEFMRLMVDDIETIAAERDYIRLNSADGSYLLRETMAGILDRLDPDKFLRVHRSTIVQRSQIESLLPGVYTRFHLKLRSGGEVNVGRSYITEVKRILGLRRPASVD